MSLRDVMEADASIFFSDFSVSAEYNDAAVEIIIEYGDDRASGNTFTTEGQAARARCWIRASSLEEPPEPLDRIVLSDEETWQVARILERDGGVYCLELIGRETVWG